MPLRRRAIRNQRPARKTREIVTAQCAARTLARRSCRCAQVAAKDFNWTKGNELLGSYESSPGAKRDVLQELRIASGQRERVDEGQACSSTWARSTTIPGVRPRRSHLRRLKKRRGSRSPTSYRNSKNSRRSRRLLRLILVRGVRERCRGRKCRAATSSAKSNGTYRCCDRKSARSSRVFFAETKRGGEGHFCIAPGD